MDHNLKNVKINYSYKINNYIYDIIILSRSKTLCRLLFMTSDVIILESYEHMICILERVFYTLNIFEVSAIIKIQNGTALSVFNRHLRELSPCMASIHTLEVL